MVQPLLSVHKGLLHIGISFQQLVYKDTHLVLEVLNGSLLLVNHPFQLCYPCLRLDQLLSQLRSSSLSLSDLEHKVIYVGLNPIPLY